MTVKEERRAKQLIDVKYGLLLQEFRVSQQGVQFLFAFLLSFPFYPRFTEVNEYQKWVYAGSLAAATLSAILFIAPVSHHQMLSGQGMKSAIVDFASTVGKAALIFLLLSMISAVFLVIDVVFNIWLSIIFGISASAVATIYWYIVPIRWGKLKDDDE